MTKKWERFSAAAVVELRTCLRAALELTPEMQNRLPQGISVSPVDATDAVACLRRLRLKPGLVLGGYQFYEGANGNGFVFAIPAEADFPEPGTCPHEQVEIVPGVFLDSPKPRDALDHFMDGFEGDGSAWSYLEASIAYRELKEFGAIWHGCDWSTHTVLDSDPFRGAQLKTADPADRECLGEESDWKWTERPAEWRPRVTIAKTGSAEVHFITFSALGQAALYGSRDCFPASSLRPESARITIAVGPGGYVF